MLILNMCSLWWVIGLFAKVIYGEHYYRLLLSKNASVNRILSQFDISILNLTHDMMISRRVIILSGDKIDKAN